MDTTVECSVAALLLCAAIAATGVRAPSSAPLLQQLAAVSAAAGLSAVPLACMYAVNNLANMHAALLSVATGAAGPTKTEKEVSEGRDRGDLGMLGVLRCGDSIAWAADGEKLPLRTVQVLSQAFFREEFGAFLRQRCEVGMVLVSQSQSQHWNECCDCQLLHPR